MYLPRQQRPMLEQLWQRKVSFFLKIYFVIWVYIKVYFSLICVLFPKMWSLLRESLCLVTWHFVAFQFNWWRHPMLPNMHFLNFLKFYFFSINRRWPLCEFESIQIGARFSESRSVGVPPNSHRPHFHSHIFVQKYREKKNRPEIPDPRLFVR